MFLETLQITFSATMQVLLLGACGYFAVKGKMLDSRGLDQLTAVLVNILLPCFAFIQLTQHFSFREFPFWWHLPVLYLVMALVALGLAYVIGFRFKGHRKNEFLALVGFQNCGNIPLVVVAALFAGQTAHTLFVYIVLYIIGANLLIWSLGVWLLLQQSAQDARPRIKFDLKRVINPPLVTTVLTMILLSVGAQHFIPDVVLKPVEMLGNCALTFAMFTVGGGLASINFKHIEFGPTALVVLTKMIVFPLLALLFVFAFKVNGPMGFLIVLEAAVPSAVTLSLIKRYYNLQEDFVSEGVFVTHLASIITIPIFLTIYMKMSGPF
ncbi:MAG: AEC family transporter [Candidatus Omnitrophica bacterium]|nr:AEC family transporter [Candidatus Omnitrophota bacterium]